VGRGGVLDAAGETLGQTISCEIRWNLPVLVMRAAETVREHVLG